MVEKEVVSEGLKEQGEVYKKVIHNMQKSQDKIGKRKLLHGVDDLFRVGDYVLLKNIYEEQRKGGKMESDMLGPMKIEAIEGKSVKLVHKLGTRVANFDHITHYIEPEERIPAKLQKLGCPSPLASCSPSTRSPSPSIPAKSPSPAPPAPSSVPSPHHLLQTIHPTHPSEPPAMKRPHDMIGPVQTNGIYFPVCDIKYSVKFYSVQMTQIMCISS